jgi:hypothetical protein
VLLELDEKAFASKDALQSSGQFASLLVVALREGLEDAAAEATRRCDQTLRVALEEFPVESGLVVVTLEIGH